MESRISRWCEGLIEAGWLAAIVLTPLFFNIHSSRVFEPDKLTLLRSIAVLMSAAWLVLFVDRKGWQSMSWLSWRSENSIWRRPFVLPVFLLVIVYLLSTVFSVTRNVSWAGSYQRLQGTYTTLSYIIVFALMLATIRRREQVTRVVTAVIITSIPVSLYAMLQHFGLDPLPWGGNVERRVAGHMGNSIFVAAYLIMAVPLTLARILDAFTNILNDEELSQADVIRSSIYIFALAIQFIAIFWTRSRGPFLGLLAGIYTFVLILLVSLRNARANERAFGASDAGRALLTVLIGGLLPLLIASNVIESANISFYTFVGGNVVLVIAVFVMAVAKMGWRWLWLSWILTAVIAAGVLLSFNIPDETAEPYHDTPIIGNTLATFAEWKELPEIGRFGQLLEAGEGSGRVRVLIWEGVLDLISPHEPITFPDGSKDTFNFLRPIIGYGPESMYVAYNGFYPPELATIEARNASPDRAHNETFDSLVITGGAGFLVWQFLYLSVFYYGFRWLGVIRTKRDRNVLIGLWIGGAIIGGVALVALLGMPFLGVALPSGTIVGLVLYLVYYAIVAQGDDESEAVDPFSVDRLLMIALVSGVLAHYVEIHFGIAIAATRTHFFVYVALMFMVGHFLPSLNAETVEAVVEEEVSATNRKRRRTRSAPQPTAAPGWTAPVLTMALILGLVLGTLGYNFMNFAIPDGEQIVDLADVPSAGEILHQSFLINVGEGFTASPFIFLVIILTWFLGSLLLLSEFSKHNLIRLKGGGGKVKPDRLRIAGAIFLALAVVGLIARFLLPVAEGGPGLNRLLGNTLILFWSGACLIVAIGLLANHRHGHLAAGIVGLLGLAFSIPIVVTGVAWFGFVMAIACGTILYLVWDSSWNDFLLPAAIMLILSLIVGLIFAYFQAFQVRSGILPPPGVTQATPAIERRVLESNQSAGLLTIFYVFTFALLFVSGLAIFQGTKGRIKQWAANPTMIAALILFPLAFYLVSTTNMRIIQADIVYKRADPWDKAAGRGGDPLNWDNAIAIYEHAIDLAPREDFYYLWLGRAYLERSGVTEDTTERIDLLETASGQLTLAQDINPLNTDHTANLARLNTRWADFSQGNQREERSIQAGEYYEGALSLSPHNSVIANEYARMAFVLQNSCEKAIELYNYSVEVDPFYPNTYFDRADILIACADQEPDKSQEYLRLAAASLEQGLEYREANANRLGRLAEVYAMLGETEKALSAYQQALESDDQVPQWQLDFTLARGFFEFGDLVRAEEFAQSALAQSPEEVQAQIETFLLQITGETAEGE
jgi:tetratricopeptide (TPR) repeat protein